MSFEGWKEVELTEVIEFNPKESLRKGMLAKKVSMADLKPFTRKIQGYSHEKYSSGSKFRNGDTLLSRITPCLENGKTAYVDILQENEVAFGSTEFIVLRGREGKADKKFVYYLTISPNFRDIAIKSMTGTTGRQRAQVDVLERARFLFPPIEEQRRIACVLSSIDEKIELNNRINKTLEEMAQAIFKSWFVDFEPFRDGEFVESELGMIPKGWEVKQLEEVVSLIIDHRGKTPKKLGGDWSSKGIPAISAKNIKENRLINKERIKYVPIDIYKKWMKDELKAGDIILTSEGPLGEVYFLASNEKYCLSQRLFALRANHEVIYPSVLFFTLRNPKTQEKISSRATGSTVLGIRQSELRKVKLLVPPIELQHKIGCVLDSLLTKVHLNEKENEALMNLRDTLLPKLMSGEIRVPLD